MLPDVTTCVEVSQVFPPHIFMLEAIEMLEGSWTNFQWLLAFHFKLMTLCQILWHWALGQLNHQILAGHAGNFPTYLMLKCLAFIFQVHQDQKGGSICSPSATVLCDWLPGWHGVGRQDGAYRWWVIRAAATVGNKCLLPWKQLVVVVV